VSKAFVREDDDGEEDAPEPARRSDKNYITPAGFARLSAEYQALLHQERPQVVERVSWAASNGDRSENGDYLYGKKRLREIDRRLRFLAKRMEAAEIVDPASRAGAQQVFFGATVALEDETGQQRTIRIVGEDEVNVTQGDISWVSPLAKALLRARVGDVVKVNLPRGLSEIEVLDIAYRPAG
jgi:transcription elongation factor GreB